MQDSANKPLIGSNATAPLYPSVGLFNPKIRPRSASPETFKSKLVQRPRTAAVSGTIACLRSKKALSSNKVKSSFYNLQFDDSVFTRLPKSKPVAKEKPLGAASAGHYTLLRQKSTKNDKSISIAELLRSITLPRPIVSQKIETPEPGSQKQRQGIIKRRGTKFRFLENADCLPDPDYVLIEEYLDKLSDIDASTKKIVDNLIALYEISQSMTDPPIAQAFSECGILSVLTNLLAENQSIPEIQIYCSLLINFTILNCSSAYESFLQSGKLNLLLKASEIAAKTAISKFTVKSGYRRNYYASAQELISAASKQELFRSSEEILEETSPKPQSTTALFVPLKSSALSKYYTESFWDNFQSQGSENRKKMFREILSSCEKIDKCVTGICMRPAEYQKELTPLENLIRHAAETLQAEVILYKYDEEKQALQAMYCDDAEYYSPTVGIVGESFQSQKLFNIVNPDKNLKFAKEVDFPTDFGHPQSLLCVPLLNSDNESVGVILAFNKISAISSPESIDFNTLDEYMIRMIAVACSRILGFKSMQESAHISTKRISVLLETTKSLGSISDFQKLSKVIMDSAAELLSSDRCALFLHDPDRNQLIASIQGRNSIEEIRIPSNAGIAGAVFTTGTSINIIKAYKDARFENFLNPRFNQEIDKKTGYLTNTILCIPIKNAAGDSIGVMQMVNKKSGTFSTEDEMLLNSFASQGTLKLTIAAVAIEKSKLFQKTEDMRIYLQSILQSITSCVITLSDNMKMSTMNRPWLAEALGIDHTFMKVNPVEKWLGPNNCEFIRDINQVFKTREAIYVSDYEAKGKNCTLIINYQIMPLIGTNGLVLVLDDISSEKRAVMTLGRYMSPALAKQVMKDGEDQLGGKRKKVSILFSDIRSFTTLSENMDPKEIVELLNHHFTDAVNAITDEQGILDKFIGDAVMAVFGVPFSSSLDSNHACNAALRMRDALVLTNKARSAQRKPAINIGIGINTGVVLSGNIGSVKRMEFSCIGDAVNVASRTEGLTKFYGIQIMVTDLTLRETGDDFISREIDLVVVSGKKKSVRLFELLGRKGDLLDDSKLLAVSHYSIGLQLYKKRLFLEASQYFAKSPMDGPSKIMHDRCLKYASNPPSENWNGAFTAEGK